eukprot:TRINITY_DN10453_c0_g1_i1.p1 TRINITY_DN10453_c0_g1~~TRINITY_DN10453_c0_g1_i1.p1  ORF type:complete len:291 (-),score=30.29 TRINITY_DN10453_c0_g1_i1:66-938(-)
MQKRKRHTVHNTNQNKSKKKPQKILFRKSSKSKKEQNFTFFSSLLSTPDLPLQPRPLSFYFGVILLSYLVFFSAIRLHYEGIEGLNDLLWLPNLTLILGAVGMLIQNTMFIGVSVACVAFSHITFTYDLFFWTFFDKFPMGRATFIEDIELDDILRWGTTLHQVWYLPLCFAILHVDYENIGLKWKYWIHSSFIIVVLGALGRYSQYKMPTNTETYLHLSTGHEFLQEPGSLIHRHDSSSWTLFILWLFLFESVFLNGMCYVFLKLLSKLLLEKDAVPDIPTNVFKTHKQ